MSCVLQSPNAKIPINKIHKQSAVLDLFNHCDDQLLSQTKWSTAQVPQYINKTEKQTADVNLIYASKHVIMYFVCVDVGRKCYLILSRWSRFDFSQSIHAAMFFCGRVRCLVENANIAKIVSVNSILPFLNLNKSSVQHFSPYVTCFVNMWKMIPQEIEWSHDESSQNRMSCGLCQLLVSVNPVAYRNLVMLEDDCLIVCPPLPNCGIEQCVINIALNQEIIGAASMIALFILTCFGWTPTHTVNRSKPSSDFSPRHRLPKESLMKALRVYRT